MCSLKCRMLAIMMHDNGVDVTERRGEFEPISTVRDHPFDDIGTKPLVIEFLHRMDSPDVL